MAADANLGLNDLEKVRIPSGLHACLDQCLGALKLSILRAAVHKAAGRRNDGGPPVVNADDIVQCAHAQFPQAASELENALRQHGTKHVRSAS